MGFLRRFVIKHSRGLWQLTKLKSMMCWNYLKCRLTFPEKIIDDLCVTADVSDTTLPILSIFTFAPPFAEKPRKSCQRGLRKALFCNLGRDFKLENQNGIFSHYSIHCFQNTKSTRSSYWLVQQSASNFCVCITI